MIKYIISLLFIAMSISTAYAERVLSNVADIDLDTKKVIHINGSIDRTVVRSVATEGMNTQAIPGDRLVIISSRGGEVSAGKVILSMLLNEKKDHPGMRLICVADQEVDSMAFNILSFCDVRLATEETKFVAHKVRDYYKGEIILTAKEMREKADEMDRLDEPYRQQNAKAMHLKLKDYDKYADDEKEWSVDELVKLKYLSGIAILGN